MVRVIDNYAYQQAQRAKHDAGVQATGFLEFMLDNGLLPMHHRAQAHQIVDDWKAAHAAAKAALDAPDRTAA